MKSIQNHIITGIAAVLGIVATAFALSDNFIAQATFSQFKEFVFYRLDSIDEKMSAIDDKLDILIGQQKKEQE